MYRIFVAMPALPRLKPAPNFLDDEEENVFEDDEV